MTTAPSTVAEVVERLRAIEGALDPSDGAAVFDTMYLHVTERVASVLGSGTAFEDPGMMAELDVRFAGLWLAAYDAAAAGRPVPSAWAPLFEQRGARGLWPIQYALAGMNAHIENDLPLAVVATCRARGVAPSHPSVRRDYEAVNAILASVEADIRRAFLSEVERQVDEAVGPLVHLVSAWNIDKARDLAWVTVEVLWAMRETGPLFTRYAATVGHTVGLASRCLLTPVGLGLPSLPAV